MGLGMVGFLPVQMRIWTPTEIQLKGMNSDPGANISINTKQALCFTCKKIIPETIRTSLYFHMFLSI